MRLLGLGDNTVDLYEHEGVMYPGGNAVNVAARAARLGMRASYLGCVGDDAHGHLVLSALSEEGVDVSRCQIYRGVETGIARVGLVDGDRTFLGATPGARAHLRLKEADWSYVRSHDIVHTSIYSYVDEAAPHLRASVGTLSWDFSNRWDLEYLDRITPHVDWAFLSSPGSPESEVARLAQRCIGNGARRAVVTQGGHGTWIQDGERAIKQAPVAVEVLDTLGAGDAFIAAMLYGVHSVDATIEDAAAHAAEYAARACQQRGGFGHGRPMIDPDADHTTVMA